MRDVLMELFGGWPDFVRTTPAGEVSVLDFMMFLDGNCPTNDLPMEPSYRRCLAHFLVTRPAIGRQCKYHNFEPGEASMVSTRNGLIQIALTWRSHKADRLRESVATHLCDNMLTGPASVQPV